MSIEIKSINNKKDKLNRGIYELEKAVKYLDNSERINLEELIYKLDANKDKLEWIAEKLKNGYIEVAFAGLEKAGKSTFVNAFIENDLLPSAKERMTFTITEVRYAPDIKIEVEFYNYDEFINDVFKKMLNLIEYPNYEDVDFDTFSETNIKQHFEYLEKNKRSVYDSHSNRTEKDIKDIIKGKNEIKKLLNLKTKIFNENNRDEATPYIIDKYKSRAVKRVIIYSPTLENLKNIIIYDLPGFDSPTIVHSKFTIETLKKVDAVVFLRKLTEPSIKGPELDIINKVKDEDGIAIKEKTFFFLNQADIEDNAEEVEKDKRKFIDELKENSLFKTENRILVGSAKAHLEFLSNSIPKPSYDKLQQLGIENEIMKLKERLEEFNENERVPILERRVSNILNDSIGILKITKTILDKNISTISTTDSKSHYFADALRQTLTSKFGDLIKETKNYLKEKELSKKIQNVIIENINQPNEDLINKISSETSSNTSTAEERPDSFNTKIREYLGNQIEKDIRESIYIILEEEIGKVYTNILEIFRNSINDNKNELKDLKDYISEMDINGEEIKNIIDNFIDKNRLLSTYELTILVIRFLQDLLEVLIKNPFKSTDRENKLKEAKGEINSLWAFHKIQKEFDFDIPISLNLIERAILYQENPKENLELLTKKKEMFKNSKNNDKDSLFIQFFNFLSIFFVTNKDIYYSLKLVIELMEKYKVNNVSQLETFFKNLEKEKIETFPLQEASNYKEVIEEVNKDIENLKELVESSVINAINPEKAFVNATSVYIRNINENLKTAKFLEFIDELIKEFSKKKLDSNMKEITKISMIHSASENIKELIENLNR